MKKKEIKEIDNNIKTCIARPKKQNKLQNAITLISLVITIIILLILAGVVLNVTLVNNGIFKLASDASKNYMDEQNKELSDLYSTIKIATGDNSQITVSMEDLNKIIDDRIKKTSITTVPAGTVISYIAGAKPPIGYLTCDGSTYKISDYPKLAEAIKSGFGNYNYYGGDGEKTFAVPNLQGEFLRGTGANNHTNQGNGADVGVHQDATSFGGDWYGDNHIEIYEGKGDWGARHSNADSAVPSKSRLRISGTIQSYTSDSQGQYTSRPTNTSVLYCIKY